MNVRKRKQAVWLLNMILPLLLGACIYLLFRHDSWVCQVMWNHFHIRLMAPQLILTEFPAICVFLRNYTGDMLWAYALFVTVAWVAGDASERKLLECVIFEVILECLQKCDMIAGTFDVYDILAEALAAFMAYCLFGKGRICVNTKKNKERDENEEQMGT